MGKEVLFFPKNRSLHPLSSLRTHLEYNDPYSQAEIRNLHCSEPKIFMKLHSRYKNLIQFKGTDKNGILVSVLEYNKCCLRRITPGGTNQIVLCYQGISN